MDVTLGQRIPVGSHYRVWWFWLPIIFGTLFLIAAAILLPIVPPLGIAAVSGSAVCVICAVVAGLLIERGRRWVELAEDSFRFSDHSVQAVISDAQVTDLAIHRQPHHGSGKLLAETRHLIVWINTQSGPQRIKLSSRMAPGAADPLQPLIDRLCRRLSSQARRDLAARETIAGEGWALDATQLHVSTRRQRTSIPLEDVSAVDQIGRELRIWRHHDPYAVARIPVSGRNGWLLHRLLLEQTTEGPSHGLPVSEFIQQGSVPDSMDPESTATGLGRILFERAAGSGPTVVLGLIGLLLGVVGGVSLWVAVRGADPIMSALGGLLILLSVLCFVGGIRVRRVCFRCYEHGLERITMTARKVLPFDDIDVFSFESRRNQSQGRYTGTTYTLVFADRSREQGRGIFYSTTVRNDDAELDDLRERVAQIIARRMAQTFAAHQSVQWTPEVWFRGDALEYNRARRLFVASKTIVVPYDTIIDFESRDGLLHLWTSYQERAVLSLNTGAPNFHPGLILLESLVRAGHPQPAPQAV